MTDPPFPSSVDFGENIKVDVLNFMREFHDRGKLSKHIGATFITLIEKKASAEYINDYRPISLIGSIYKILAKVLTTRLQKVLPQLISTAQGAFFNGRQILDDALIANECIDPRYRQRTPGIIYKLDLEKAFDWVNKEFLQYLMRMGFGVK